MSKGGAGKVYFVLYLAVILELLIIIVERDEAEELLIQKQKESMKIVESILSQLQSGAGSESISTRPQDEITIQEVKVETGGDKIKQDRLYFVEVGVTDVTREKLPEDPKERTNRLNEFKKLSNVQELSYQILYHPSNSPERAPDFPSEEKFRTINLSAVDQAVGDEVEGGVWRLQTVRQIVLNTDKMTSYHNPVYEGFNTNASIGEVSSFTPQGTPQDSIFTYSEDRTLLLQQRYDGKLKKRVFVVKFQPPHKAGWYKLRFASRTNLILGVRSDGLVSNGEVADNYQVNIGTVQLKVKDLRTVKKQLEDALDGVGSLADDLIAGKIKNSEFEQKLEKIKQETATVAEDEKKTELLQKLELFGYISKLLAPGQSDYFERNKGAIEFDVRVILPKIQILDPVISNLPEKIYSFDKLPKMAIPFESGPAQFGKQPVLRSLDPSIRASIVARGGQVASSNGDGPTTRAYEIQINGEVPSRDEPYPIIIEQGNQVSKLAYDTCWLRVFPSRLENAEDLTAQLAGGVFFGADAIIDIVPASGQKIPGSQFKTLISTGGDQESAVTGFSANKCVSASTTFIKAKVMWSSTFSSEIVTLFEGEGAPKQKPPRIVKANAKASSLDPKLMDIIITGVNIQEPLVDCGGARAVPTEIQDVKVQITRQDLGNYKASATYKRSGSGLEIIVHLEGTPNPPRKNSIDGTVDLLITAKCKNSKNGSSSAEGKEILKNIVVSY